MAEQNNTEKITYTITPSEFRQRQKSRLSKIVAFLLIGMVLLGATGYGFGGWVWAIICAVGFLVLIVAIVWHERRMYGNNWEVTLDDWGLHIKRGNKTEEHAWSDFSKGMTMTDFNKSTNVGNPDFSAEGDRLTRAAYGEVFILIYKKQPWLKPGWLKLLAEPDNHVQVRAFLERHVKWGIYDKDL